MDLFKMFINEIIELSNDNSSGTLLDEKAIDNIIEYIIKSYNLNKNNIDLLINKYETEGGYLIKANDFVYVLKPYLIGDNFQFNGENIIEKDYEMIELLYGDFHAECGDRD